MTIQEDIQKAITKEEMYSIGESVPADWQLAFDLYMQLAKAGDAKA
jgi:TPR repeat protein